MQLSEMSDLLARSWTAPEGSLTIRYTDLDDSGQYTCEIVNASGERQETSAYLNVTCKDYVAQFNVFLRSRFL